MNILFIGDVVGHSGLRELLRQLPELRDRFQPDCIIVNGENIVDGKGLSDKEAHELFSAGVHCITTGNHVWENWKARPLLAERADVLRPMNYPAENPGRGWTLITLPDRRVVAVMQAQGRAYMQAIDCPFKAVDAAIKRVAMDTKIILLDFHADASAEKIAMGWHCDGRVSAVVGTHTHTQTADARLLPQGTAFISDVGMTGPYDSVLGMKKDIALKRLLLQTAHKYEVAESDLRVAGVCLVIDESSGKAQSITPFVSPMFKTSI